jgi:hypothetical protein
MFYVYHGYVSADRYDASEGPLYEITECRTVDDVMKLLAEHHEAQHNECANAIFRVFEGQERKLSPVNIVEKWELK